ncbi:MAG: DUF4159 domain-containing protein [Pseudomonadota bacterium]
MMTLGPLAFAAPWVLLALGLLPAIYWLLRVTPPPPRVMAFPAIRLLADLVAKEETPDRTPLWVLLLRLALAALLILGLSQPILNPPQSAVGTGTLVVLVENGWASGRDWPARQARLQTIIDTAQRSRQEIVIIPTADIGPDTRSVALDTLRANDAQRLLPELAPRPWEADRAAVLETLGVIVDRETGHGIWLSDGLARPNDDDITRLLLSLGSAEIALPDQGNDAVLLRPPEPGAADLDVTVERALSGGEEALTVHLLTEDGRLLDRVEAVFADGDTAASARFTLPAEGRNEAAVIRLADEVGAGGVALLDERWARRPVGIAGRNAAQTGQPLLNDTYYVNQALAPFSETRIDAIETLFDSSLAVLMLPDSALATGIDEAAISDWVEDGGVLVRFAGSLLAANPDSLTPVDLRSGDRLLSGALSWTEPAPLGAFPQSSPFAGLPVPEDVLIERQVLAQPGPDLTERAWAQLVDGTPLVTAARRGEGWIVLFHTAATPDWSNLPISGLFVDMLRRLVDLSAGIDQSTVDGTYQPLSTLDGFGRLGEAPTSVLALTISDGVIEGDLGPSHPPGLYGQGTDRQAINLADSINGLTPLEAAPANAMTTTGYVADEATSLAPALLTLALILLAIDGVVALVLRGMTPGDPRRLIGNRQTAAGILLVGIAMAALPGAVDAQDNGPPSDLALLAANETYLAYLITGEPAVDEISRAGLEGLSTVLRTRTAVEAAGAIGVDPRQDELALFPLIYWAITPNQRELDRQARDGLNRFMANGGTLIIDTRDQGFAGGGLGAGAARLRQLAEGLEIPALMPVPPQHVLTKAFYLMQDFPGRYAGGSVWVADETNSAQDGVSPVVVGGADWAAAWATNQAGQPLHMPVPGGEPQREMAYRFGVNLVIYTLTGNYKADQVHVPAILERLGQ